VKYRAEQDCTGQAGQGFGLRMSGVMYEVFLTHEAQRFYEQAGSPRIVMSDE